MPTTFLNKYFNMSMHIDFVARMHPINLESANKIWTIFEEKMKPQANY